MKKEIITVNGMSCDHCRICVESAVKQLNGVKSVKVNIKKGSAAVKFDDAEIDVSEIRNAITEAGYEAV